MRSPGMLCYSEIFHVTVERVCVAKGNRVIAQAIRSFKPIIINSPATQHLSLHLIVAQRHHLTSGRSAQWSCDMVEMPSLGSGVHLSTEESICLNRLCFINSGDS